MSGSVEGKVMRSDGLPVTGATVLIVKGPGPAPDIAPVSDDAGHFVLDGLGEGTYVLRAFGTAEETGETVVSIYPDKVTHTEILLKR